LEHSLRYRTFACSVRGVWVNPVRSRADARVMVTLRNVIAKLARDERGGEVLEYALIAGLIVVAAIAVIGSVGTKVLARWNSLNASM